MTATRPLPTSRLGGAAADLRSSRCSSLCDPFTDELADEPSDVPPLSARAPLLLEAPLAALRPDADPLLEGLRFADGEHEPSPRALEKALLLPRLLPPPPRSPCSLLLPPAVAASPLAAAEARPFPLDETDETAACRRAAARWTCRKWSW